MLSRQDSKDMNFSMRLSFVIGLLMLVMKCYAFYITGSAAILSDALESVIHVIAVGFALYSMWLSLKPADKNHPYGHDKISFFSAGFEGAMIIIAALLIFYEAILKLLYGPELSHLGEGILFTAAATLINLALSFYLISQGKKYRSIILEANGKHILTDVWTSVAVIFALLAVKITGYVWLDPLIAILAAANILWTGFNLIKKSVTGLMDGADPKLDKKIVDLLSQEMKTYGLDYHELRHRLSGHKVFIEFHLLFPHDLYLGRAHEIASQIEQKLQNELPVDSEIISHLELKSHHDEIHAKYGLKG